MERQDGFTLIELMIVVVIVAILAAIAYPNYQEHVRKTRRADCEGALMSLGNALERYFTNNSTYVGATLGDGSTATDVFVAKCPIEGDAVYYNLNIASQSATAFQVQATPTGAQANDRCGTLSLDQTGMKGASGGDVDECW